MVIAADLMRTDVTPLQATDPLDRALGLFAESNLLELPVVDGSSSTALIGMVRRSDVARTYVRHVQGTTSGRPG
jgi:CBS domain-containing protein